MMEQKEYSINDLEHDILWMGRVKKSSDDAREFIYYLLNSTPSERLKALMIAEKL